MKAITLWQPWASLLACGAKQFETRSWATSYRGPIAIHAAAKSISSILAECFPCYQWDFHPSNAAFKGFLKACGYETIDTLRSLPLGAVVATAELIGCRQMLQNPYDGVIHFLDETDAAICPTSRELFLGDWTPGRYAWEFSNMKMLDKPIPAKGGQRIWNWEGLS